MAIDIPGLRRQIDLVAYAQTLTRLKKSGAHWRGECPCCGGASKDPFLVDAGSGTSTDPHWNCFACGERGDVFNLAQLQRTGSPHIPSREFPAVVRAVAEQFGITLPDADPSRVRSSEEVLRDAITEAWAITHDYARAESGAPSPAVALLLAGPAGHGLTVEQRTAYGLGAIDPTALDLHLTRLGVTAEVRRAAGLATTDLARLTPGLVWLREGRDTPGLTQEQPTLTVHLAPSGGAGFRPALLSAPARGRTDERQLVVTLDWTAAFAAAARHARLLADPALGDDTQRRLRTVAIAYHHPQEPVDVAAYTRLVTRALILLPSERTDERRLVGAGTQWLARGVGVRVADIWQRDRLSDVLEAREFTRWQFETHHADEGAAPGSAEASAWFTSRIAPFASQLADPGLGAIVQFRALTHAGLIQV